MKVQIVKLGNNLAVTLQLINRNGLPIRAQELQTITVKSSKPGTAASTVTPTKNADGTISFSLTYATEIAAAGLYSVQVSGKTIDNQEFDYTEPIAEVKSDTDSAATTFRTSMIIPEVGNIRGNVRYIADSSTVQVEDGALIIGTSIDKVTFAYDVNSHFNAQAIISYAAAGSTHDATLPTGYKYTGTMPTEAVSKTYLYNWTAGILSVAEVKS